MDRKDTENEKGMIEMGAMLAKRQELRNKETNDTAIRLRNISLDQNKRTVRVDGEEIPLTKTEFALFYYLVQNKNIAVSREKIMNHVWGYDYLGETNIVDVYIRYLRTKLDDRFHDKYIFTIRGVGYLVREWDE